MLFSRIGGLGRSYRNIKRFRQIVAILLKYGFDDILDRLHISHYLDRGIRVVSKGRRPKETETLSRNERIRMAFEELGPTFIKMAQVLSTRPDLISLGLVNELAKLQDHAPAVPYAQVEEIIRRELAQPLEGCFLRFEEAPLAAASIGQVHRATLRGGEEVIVKVQRPGIGAVLAVDLEILYYLAQLTERYLEEGEIYRPTLIVEEFARTLEQEMDYTWEAAQAERFAQLFAGRETLYVPRIFREFTTKAVLTMEYVAGIKVSDLAALDAGGYDRRLIASRGADLILDQIFRYGFFHGDPHPGNVLILPGNVICYLDFGMMGRVDRYAQDRLAEMLAGYAQRDESKVAEAVLKMVESRGELNRRSLERDIARFMETYLYRPLKELRLGDLAADLLNLFSRHRLRLPPDIYLMVKALAEMESIGTSLDPDFNMAQKVAPFIGRLRLARLDPRRVFKDLLASGEETINALRDIPPDIAEVIKQIKQGKVRIGFEHRGLEKLIFEMDRSSNRLSFALIISSVVIASSLIITADIGPRLFGFPILGLAGYSIAAFMGIWLLISILRSGKI